MSEGKRERRTSIAARARELGVHRATLKRLIDDGEGPSFIRLGRRTICIPDDKWESWKRRNTCGRDRG